MADEPKTPDVPTMSGPPANPMSVQVQVDTTKLQTIYTNFFRLSLSSSTEEVVMDVGLHTGIMAGGGMEAIGMSHRLVMNPYVAKRLIESLRQIVARHEQAFGALEVDPQKRLRQR
ncbi:MAG: DUF3467 domain-containing protein [Fimbriiglobus sp.]